MDISHTVLDHKEVVEKMNHEEEIQKVLKEYSSECFEMRKEEQSIHRKYVVSAL